MRRPSIVRLFLLVSLSIVALLLAGDHAGAGKLSRPSRGVAQAGASQKAALSPFSIAHPLPVSTLTVTNTNDAGSGSLRQAIIDASSGETIKFSVTGTIRLTSGQLTIDKNLTINGPGANLLTISGNNDDQVGTVSSPKDPMLGTLANNGGPTQTMALLSGSQAIDAGTDVTTLNGDINNAVTTVTVTDGTSIPAGVGFLIQIDNEQMNVTAKSTNTLTVMRAANGTTAGSHSNGAAVNPAFDQRDTGFPRKIGSAVDIGAFEACAAPATPPASNGGPYCEGATISLSTPTVSGATYS